ncbi:MAG TPA: hypothetical protein VFM16_01220 [Holophagaceae bacterium]|nr:hypothetical protein [Holophagaceae bacterium]
MTYPNERPPQRDRYILVPLFLLVPAALVWGIVLPAQRRMSAARARIEAANAQLETISHVTPLTSQERKVLEDPQAGWRRRMPLLTGDAARLDHYAAVVTALQSGCAAVGARVEGLRSSWDPIQADFTSPGPLPATRPEGPAPQPADAAVGAWALEVQLTGQPAALGAALDTLPRLEPLMIPVGLRWEAREGQPFQALVLRDLFLSPPPESAPATTATPSQP